MTNVISLLTHSCNFSGLTDLKPGLKMRIQRLHSLADDTLSNQAITDLSQLKPLIEKYKNKKGNVIPLLQGTQDIFGFIPTEAFLLIAEETGLKLSDMYGVATFYSQFRLHPVGKHVIKVCHGTACHVQNAGSITEAIEEGLNVKDGETTEDGLFTLESVACLGCCSLAPVMMIGDETFGKLTGKSAVRVIKDIRVRESQQEASTNA
jgi:NADH-quinone oxidoreductase subunit E